MSDVVSPGADKIERSRTKPLVQAGPLPIRYMAHTKGMSHQGNAIDNICTGLGRLSLYYQCALAYMFPVVSTHTCSVGLNREDAFVTR